MSLILDYQKTFIGSVVKLAIKKKICKESRVLIHEVVEMESLIRSIFRPAVLEILPFVPRAGLSEETLRSALCASSQASLTRACRGRLPFSLETGNPFHSPWYLQD